MFSSTTHLSSKSSRRTATLCSAAVHVTAVGALWAMGQAITVPPVQERELREAVRLVSPPPRLFRPRMQPKAREPRFEIERTTVTRPPEPIREAPRVPSVTARADPAPVLLPQPELVVTRPAPKSASFGDVARATVSRIEAEPVGAAFGAALGKHTTTNVIPPGDPTSFGAAGSAKAGLLAAAIGDGGFGGVEISRTVRRTDSTGAAGFGAAERRAAEVDASEPASTNSRSQPVKILWKPVPKYSEEGIRRRIEGDVVLLVRFLARGTVETLEVVNGLGYGLDEYALQAAEAIRFEPALLGDQAVDFTAQVRIRFELAY